MVAVEAKLVLHTLRDGHENSSARRGAMKPMLFVRRVLSSGDVVDAVARFLDRASTFFLVASEMRGSSLRTRDTSRRETPEIFACL